MEKNTDIDGFSEKVGADFEYRQFASSSNFSNEPQRWKLLDSISKHARPITPGSVERSSQASLAPTQPQEQKESLMPRDALWRSEAVCRAPAPVSASCREKLEEPSVPAPIKRHSFSHLFETYKDNKDEQYQNDHEGTSLKALLGQINS